tara:strand:+ start:5210 stop:5728 length:519 start_codon:yes stop_codon:yes gene_type:complete
MGHFDKLQAKKVVAAGIQAPATGMIATAGTDIVDSADALAMDSSYLNKITFSALDGADKTVTLPTFSNVGETVTIVQKVDLVGSGVLQIDCAGSQSFDTGSYASFVAASETTGFDTAASGETKLVLTGTASNSGVGAGSRVKLTYLGGDKILCECLCQPLGTGSNTAAAFAA